MVRYLFLPVGRNEFTDTILKEGTIGRQDKLQEQKKYDILYETLHRKVK